MTFTPPEFMYSRDGLDVRRDPYAEPVYAWTFHVEQDNGTEPAVWMVPAGQQTGVKLSVCVDGSGTEWSDLSEAAPEFTPLPAPPDQEA
jgi:hypothetical protein